MKNLYLTAGILFVVAVVFKLLHYPGAGLFLLASTLSIVVNSLLYFAKNIKTDPPLSFLHIAFSSWTVYPLFRLQFWSIEPRIGGVPLLFIVSCCISLIWLVLHIHQKRKFELVHILFMIYFTASLALSYTPAHRVYYFFNLTPSLHSQTRTLGYEAWDRYSWFLYQAGEAEKALQANSEARKAANEYAKDYDVPQAAIEAIEKHKQQIEDENWTEYLE